MTGTQDRVALVVGANGGIGRATAHAFAASGARVVVAARTTDALEDLVGEITAHGGQALAVPTDVTDEGAVARLVDRTLDAFGRLDAAVNNAAGAGPMPTPLAEITVDDFDKSVSVGIGGLFLCLKHQIPAMLASGGGAIVNMASTAGLEAVGGLAPYVLTKFAIVGMTRTAALDYADQGVRVNALAPGPIHTDQLERAGERARAHVAATIPAHRLGRPSEVADAAVWLCSPAAGFITGVTLPVDGGLLAGMPPFQKPPAPRLRPGAPTTPDLTNA